MEKYNTEEILRESQENVKKLNEKLKDIETLHNEIKESVSLSLKNPILFKDLAQKLNGSAELYLEGNNKIFEGKIIEISSKITELGAEINRLTNVDLNALFKELETQFLENSKKGIESELKKIEEKSNQIQIKIDELGNEVTRLSKIDLEVHFDRHQSKLSEVFISVNGVNGVLVGISQNINKLIQLLGEIDQIIIKNQKELLQSFDDVLKINNDNKCEIVANLNQNQKELKTKLNESDVKMDSIILQNEALKKEVDFNKKLTFVIIFLVIVSIVIKFI
jgi:DNA repair exonuclease SbcCD ATPase subunit